MKNKREAKRQAPLEPGLPVYHAEGKGLGIVADHVSDSGVVAVSWPGLLPDPYEKVEDLTPHWLEGHDPYEVGCAKCGAGRNAGCRTVNGRNLQKAHAKRRDLWTNTLTFQRGEK